jgi:formylmethanofuran dehydrogenase subunit E
MSKPTQGKVIDIHSPARQRREMIRCDRCGEIVSEENFDEILELCRWCAEEYRFEAEEERDRMWNSGD